MALTTNPHGSVQNQDDGVLDASLSPSATSATISPVKKWISGVLTTGGFDSSAGFVKIIDSTGRYEFASFDTKVVSAANITTISGMRRGLSVTASGYTSGTGLQWDANTRIYVTDYAVMWQDLVDINTNQTITGTKTLNAPLNFGGTSAYIKTTDSGTNLKFKDANNAEVTLSQLYAQSGTDHKVMVNSSDTSPNYLYNKLLNSGVSTITAQDQGGGNYAIVIGTDTSGIANTGSFTKANITVDAFGRVTAASSNSAENPIGILIDYSARTAPTGWLMANGQAVSRSTYSALFNVICPTIGTFTVTIASPAVFTLTSHGLIDGDSVYFTTTGALPTGLTANTIYYVISAGLGANTFQVSATVGGSAINTSVSQSGTHTLVLCPYGLGNGSTTFNVPDGRGRIFLGSDTMGTTAASRITTTKSAIGITGGSELVASHTHSMTQAGLSAGGGGSVVQTGTTGSSQPYGMNPFLTTYKIIFANA